MSAVSQKRPLLPQRLEIRPFPVPMTSVQREGGRKLEMQIEFLSRIPSRIVRDPSSAAAVCVYLPFDLGLRKR